MEKTKTITLNKSEKVELTEREQEIYDKGYSEGWNKSWRQSLLVFTCIIIFFALLFILIKKTTVEW